MSFQLGTMLVGSEGVKLAGTDYTWQQTWRFFIIGAIWAVGAAVLPALWIVGWNYVHYSDPIDWPLVWGAAATTAGPILYSYWVQHKNLLKLPPFFQIPPEFHPEIKTSKIEERSPHSTETTSTEDGTVIEKRSEHETKVTTETTVDLKPNEPPNN